MLDNERLNQGYHFDLSYLVHIDLAVKTSAPEEAMHNYPNLVGQMKPRGGVGSLYTGEKDKRK